jgi:hypothetical protein
MKTLYLNRKAFLDFYFTDINFTDFVYVALLNDGKYEIDIDELLQSVTFIPQNILEKNQDFKLLENGNIDLENVTLKIN